MNYWAFRLEDGQDLKKEVDREFERSGFASGVMLSGIGGLSTAVIRTAGGQQSLTLLEDLEVLSLEGTLSPDGAHLHGSVADVDGAVLGGHFSDGCLVRLSMEIVFCDVPGFTFARAFDPNTRYAELHVSSG